MVLNQMLFVILIFFLTHTAQCDEFLPVLVYHKSNESRSLQGDDECPTWFHPVRSGSGIVSCECGSSLGGIVKCSHKGNSTHLLTPGYCMSTNYSNLGSFGTVVGQCPYSYIGSSVRYHYMQLPRTASEINNHTCDVLNRTGLLCAHCKDGLGPAVMSYKLQCLECLESYKGLLWYLFLACFPTTLLFLLMIIFKIHATSPSLNVIAFGSQILISTANKNLFPYSDSIQTMSRILKLIGFTIAGIWNLDFFRYVLPPFCLSHRLSNIHVLALEYIVALYPLALIIATYMIIELHARNCWILTSASKLFTWCFIPCKRLRVCTRLRNWDPKATIIHAFSTFLLLSYSKLLYVSFNLLASTKLYNMNGTDITPAVLYYDATTQYFSNAHHPFASLAIAVLSTLIGFPPLLLLLYPTRLFQKCLGCCSVRLLPLHAFMDTFQGYYKNGTNGTHDYRSFSGIYLILRILFLTMNLTDFHYNWIVGIVCPMIVSLFFALLRPYKHNWYNVLDCVFLAQIALFEFWILYSRTTEVIKVPHVLIYTVSAVTGMYFAIFSSFKLLKWFGLLQKCKQKLYLVRQQLDFRNTQQHLEDDALQNEFPHRLENPGEYQSLLSPPITSAVVKARVEHPDTVMVSNRNHTDQLDERRSHNSYGSFY